MKTEKIMIRPLGGFGEVRQNHKTGFCNLVDVERVCTAKRAAKGLAPKDMRSYFRTQSAREYFDTLMDIALRDPDTFPFLPKEIAELSNEECLEVLTLRASARLNNLERNSKGKLIKPTNIFNKTLKNKAKFGEANSTHQTSKSTTKFMKLREKLEIPKGTSKRYAKFFEPKKIFVKESRAQNFRGSNAHPLVFLEVARTMDPELAVEANIILLNGLLKARDDSGNSYRPMIGVVIKAFGLKMRIEISVIFSDFAKEVQHKILGNYASGSWERATIKELEQRSALQQKVINAAPWAAKSEVSAEEFLEQMLET